MLRKLPVPPGSLPFLGHALKLGEGGLRFPADHLSAQQSTTVNACVRTAQPAVSMVALRILKTMSLGTAITWLLEIAATPAPCRSSPVADLAWVGQAHHGTPSTRSVRVAAQPIIGALSSSRFDAAAPNHVVLNQRRIVSILGTVFRISTSHHHPPTQYHPPTLQPRRRAKPRLTSRERLLLPIVPSTL